MSNRIALVTGAARGLGAVVARRFHEAGYRVALADIAIEPAQALAHVRLALAVPARRLAVRRARSAGAEAAEGSHRRRGLAVVGGKEPARWADRAAKPPGRDGHSLLGALKTPDFLTLGLVYFLIQVASYGLNFWAPHLIHVAGTKNPTVVASIPAFWALPPKLLTGAGAALYRVDQHAGATRRDREPGDGRTREESERQHDAGAVCDRRDERGVRADRAVWVAGVVAQS